MKILMHIFVLGLILNGHLLQYVALDLVDDGENVLQATIELSESSLFPASAIADKAETERAEGPKELLLREQVVMCLWLMPVYSARQHCVLCRLHNAPEGSAVVVDIRVRDIGERKTNDLLRGIQALRAKVSVDLKAGVVERSDEREEVSF